MQRQWQQAIAGTEARGRKAAQVKWRSTRDNNFRKLLSLCFQRRLFINRVLAIRDVVERRAKNLLEMFEVLR